MAKSSDHQTRMSAFASSLRDLANVVALTALVATSACSTPHAAPVRSASAGVPQTLTVGHVQQAAIACARSSGRDFATFARCTRQQIILSPRQQGVLDCALASHATQQFAECAAPLYGVTLNKSEILTADCALQSHGTASGFAACAGTTARGRRITPREQAMLRCSAKAEDSVAKFSGCAANDLFGKQASREQRIALECAASQGANFAAFTTCAGANFFNVRLNDEQTTAIECVISTGAQPAAAAACIATRFAVRELKKCVTSGYGGAHGCFGDDNNLVGRNGWTARTYVQVSTNAQWLRESANIWVATNPFLQRSRDWWKGTGKFVQNPRQYWAEHHASVEQSK